MAISSIPITTIDLAPVKGAHCNGLLKGKLGISNVNLDVFAVQMIRPRGSRTRWQPFCKKEMNETVSTILSDLVKNDSATTKIQGYEGNWALYALPEEINFVWSKKERLWREVE